MSKVQCPFCKHVYVPKNVEPITEDEEIEMTCIKCDKEFLVTAYYRVSYICERKPQPSDYEPQASEGEK